MFIINMIEKLEINKSGVSIYGFQQLEGEGEWKTYT
jgi:hypothetical protein